MRALLKNLGIVLMCMGVVLLAIGFFNNRLNNQLLAGAMALIVGGLITYIVINKKVL